MLGPVFFLELRLAVRRGRLNAFRTIYGSWWLVQFTVLCLILFHYETDDVSPGTVLGPIFNLSFQVFVAQQFIFLVLATPAFVAGALTHEKTPGTLQPLLTTGLSSGAILLGKFPRPMALVAPHG